MRTVYFAYGHDEEAGGTAGARKIAELLKSRGVELDGIDEEEPSARTSCRASLPVAMVE